MTVSNIEATRWGYSKFFDSLTLPDRRESFPLSSVPAVILCGGRNLRLKEVTFDICPKHVIQLTRSQVVLDYPISFLREAGVQRIILATVGHAVDQIRGWYRADALGGIYYSVQEEAKGIISALAQTLGEFKINTPFIIAMGDEVITRASLREMYGDHVLNNHPISVLVTDHLEARNNFVAWLAYNQRITKVERLLEKSRIKGAFTVAGLWIVNLEWFPLLKGAGNWEEFIQNSCRNGLVFGHPSHCQFSNVNTPSDLYRIRSLKS